MITREELKQLVVAASNPRSVNVNFADAQSAARNGLIEFFGLENLTARAIRENENAIFAIIEEAIDEVAPTMLESRIGDFAEIKSFNRNDEIKFTVKNLGGRRVVYGIKPGARGGIYRAHRLDDKDLVLDTKVYTVAYAYTLEEILAGSKNIADVVSLIVDGFTEIVYVEVMKALRATYANLPANNKAQSSSNGVIDYNGLDKVIRTVSAYGRPVIIGFSNLVDKIVNHVSAPSGLNPNLPTQDLDELRSKGYVSMYRSTPIVKIPNYFVDATNTQWYFKENDLFVLPADVKPVKVGLRGEAVTIPFTHPSGSQEWNVHKMMGVGLVFNNNIGMYRDQSADNGLY